MLWICPVLLGLAISPQAEEPTQTQERETRNPVLLAEFSLLGGSGQSLALNREGTLLASAGDEGDLVLYDLETDRILWSKQLESHWMAGVSFSPDGNMIVCCGDNLYVLDLQAEMIYSSGSGGRRSAAWSPDGKSLAVLMDPRTIRVLDTSTWKEIHQYEPVGSPLEGLTFLPDGETILGGDKIGKVWRFERESPDPILHAEFPDTPNGVKSVYWTRSTDGTIIAGRGTGQVMVGDKVFPAGMSLFGMAVLPNSKGILVSGRDPLLKLFDLEGETIQEWELPGSAADVSSAVEQARIAVTCSDGRIRILDRGEPPRDLFLHPAPARSLAFTSDGAFLVASGESSAFHEIATGETRFTDQVLGLATGRSEGEIFALDHDGLHLLDPADGKISRSYPIEIENPSRTTLSVSPAGDHLLIGHGWFYDDGIAMLDLRDGSREDISVVVNVSDFAWENDGKSWIAGCGGGHHGATSHIFSFDMETRETTSIRCMTLEAGAVISMDMDPTGNRLVFAVSGGWRYSDGTDGFHSMSLGQDAESRYLPSLPGGSFVRFLDEGRVLTSSGWQDPQWFSIRDAHTLEEISGFHVKKGFSPVLSPDKSMLAVASDTAVYLYRLAL